MVSLNFLDRLYALLFKTLKKIVRYRLPYLKRNQLETYIEELMFTIKIPYICSFILMQTPNLEGMFRDYGVLNVRCILLSKNRIDV